MRGLNALPLNLPAHSEVYAGAAYTDYQAKDALQQTAAIALQVARKHNSKRSDLPCLTDIKHTSVTSLKRSSAASPLAFLKPLMP